MNFEKTANQKMISQMVRDFAEKEIRPFVMEWDESQFFPRKVFRKMGELGLMGVLVPEEYGGSGMGYNEYISVIEEVSKVCGSVGLSVAAHNSLCTNHILEFANEEQKQKYLPKLASGEWIGAWGMTEANTGSDAMRMKCVGVEDGDHYVINGTKTWITHGISGEVAVVLVRTGDLLDSHGITAFIIERSTPGFSGGKKENKLGMRASETAELIFDNCRVHKSQIIGNVEAAVKYAKEREQFGQPIANFQAIAFKLADMALEIEASEALLYQAAYLKNNKMKVTKEGAMAKYYASEVAVRVSTEAVQIFGGYGYTKDFPVEKFYRDSKLCTIGEGTSEIQKLVISREILKG